MKFTAVFSAAMMMLAASPLLVTADEYQVDELRIKLEYPSEEPLNVVEELIFDSCVKSTFNALSEGEDFQMDVVQQTDMTLIGRRKLRNLQTAGSWVWGGAGGGHCSLCGPWDDDRRDRKLAQGPDQDEWAADLCACLADSTSHKLAFAKNCEIEFFNPIE